MKVRNLLAAVTLMMFSQLSFGTVVRTIDISTVLKITNPANESQERYSRTYLVTGSDGQFMLSIWSHLGAALEGTVSYEVTAVRFDSDKVKNYISKVKIPKGISEVYQLVGDRILTYANGSYSESIAATNSYPVSFNRFSFVLRKGPQLHFGENLMNSFSEALDQLATQDTKANIVILEDRTFVLEAKK